MIFDTAKEEKNPDHKSEDIPVSSSQDLIVGAKHGIRTHIHPHTLHTAHCGVHLREGSPRAAN